MNNPQCTDDISLILPRTARTLYRVVRTMVEVSSKLSFAILYESIQNMALVGTKEKVSL